MQRVRDLKVETLQVLQTTLRAFQAFPHLLSAWIRAHRRPINGLLSLANQTMIRRRWTRIHADRIKCKPIGDRRPAWRPVSRVEGRGCQAGISLKEIVRSAVEEELRKVERSSGRRVQFPILSSPQPATWISPMPESTHFLP